MKTLQLNCFWKTYNVELNIDKYTNNNRTYLWLIDVDDWEPFCDLSENHVEIPDEIIYWLLPWHEAIVIDNDFIACFNSEREAKIWLRDNLAECVITWDIQGRPVFYIKDTRKHEA